MAHNSTIHTSISQFCTETDAPDTWLATRGHCLHRFRTEKSGDYSQRRDGAPFRPRRGHVFLPTAHWCRRGSRTGWRTHTHTHTHTWGDLVCVRQLTTGHRRYESINKGPVSRGDTRRGSQERTHVPRHTCISHAHAYIHTHADISLKQIDSPYTHTHANADTQKHPPHRNTYILTHTDIHELRQILHKHTHRHTYILIYIYTSHINTNHIRKI